VCYVIGRSRIHNKYVDQGVMYVYNINTYVRRYVRRSPLPNSHDGGHLIQILDHYVRTYVYTYARIHFIC
jgi:hypothetical protein